VDKHLFDGFPPVSSKAWKQQIQYELNGADYGSLVWESPEGIKVKPFYHADQDAALWQTGRSGAFSICQEIFVHDIAKSARRAAESLTRGAESLKLTLGAGADLSALFAALPENTPVYLDMKFLSPDAAQQAASLAKSRNLKLRLLTDPIGHLAADGNWFPGSDNFDALKKSDAGNLESFVSVDAALYQNSGADIVQQIAYGISHAIEYFNRIEPLKPIVMQVAVGSDYFFEIAKLRALRLVHAEVAKTFGYPETLHILAMPTRRNKTIYDYNNNMLRTTAECMAAILGGADAIANLPYDALYHKSNEFGERIARNQLLILKNESHFDKVENAADGSYYIESLTGQLAEKALRLAKEIENSGGFLKLLREGTIQRKIAQSAEKEQESFDSGKTALIGINKYPNAKDRMKDDLELFPFVKQKARKTLVTPVIAKRLAEKAEKQRLQDEAQ
jgi:methylmalonyl-CoA mutase